MSKLESLIQKGSEYLRTESDLNSPEAEIKFCKQKEWSEWAIKNRVADSVNAFYHPRENRVYSLSGVSLPDLLHEFFGHALFAEQTILGKKLKDYETDVEFFENKYGIPKDVVLSVRHLDGEKFRVEKNPDFQKSFKTDLSKKLTKSLEENLLEQDSPTVFLESLSNLISDKDYNFGLSAEDKSEILKNLEEYGKVYVKTKGESLIKCIEHIFDILIKNNIQANKDSNCEYFLFCDTKDEEVQKYLQLKKDYKAFFEKVRPVQEGFAVWMEKLILEGLGMNELWKEREEQIQQNKYYNDCFQWFSKDIETHGALSILYGLGFPKSSDQKILTRFAKESLKSFEGLKYLIKYGSGKRDLDMLAVYDDNVKIQVPHIYHENAADISLMNESVFLNKLKLFDIELTEPVLTGELLVGDEGQYGKIKEGLTGTKPSEQAAEYAKKRALETYNSATFFINQHKYKSYKQLIDTKNADEIATKILNNQNTDCTSKDLLYALVNLSFSISYDSTAKHYSIENKVASFEELLKSEEPLRDIMSCIKDVEHGKEKLTEEKTEYFLELTKNKLLERY